MPRGLLVGVAAAVIVATMAGGTVAALAKTVTVTVDGGRRTVTTLSGTVAGALRTAGLTVTAHDVLAPAASTLIGDGSAIVLRHGKQFTVSVDGSPRELWTTAPTVAAALAADGIPIGPHDVLAPAAETPVTDGVSIVIDRGRQLTLTVDGWRQQVWTTARTVGAALALLGRHAEDYQLSASRSREIPLAGLAVAARTLHTVTIADGGTPAVTLTSAASTVGDLLAAGTIGLGHYDTISPAPSTPMHDGLAIVITRTAMSVTESTVVIPQPPDERVHDAELDRGSTSLVQHGTPGTAVVIVQEQLVNGVQTLRTELARTITAPATPTIEHVGTRPPVQWVGDQVFFHDTSFGVNWDGLARCESTHNPRAINAYPSAGLPTYGLFQFDLPTWRSVGGTGNPIDASPAEQLERAKALFQSRGLEPWACRYAAH